MLGENEMKPNGRLQQNVRLSEGLAISVRRADETLRRHLTLLRLGAQVAHLGGGADQLSNLCVAAARKR